MIYVFNIVLLLLVGVIAYWWANQGLFSAILHLVCVVAAGAIAFGVWEPFVVGLCLRGSWFDYYAWGVCLIVVFAVSLFVLRLAMDKLCPGNIDLPHWANLCFGFPVGLAAGIITMGVVIIGTGHIQSHVEIMGYRGYGFTKGGPIMKYAEQMWLPVHQMTSEFYGFLSVGSMWTPKPLHHYNPDLHWQSSLIRASSGDGEGQISMPPKGVTVRGAFVGPDPTSRNPATPNTVAVDLSFSAAALDFGDQLTLSSSQLRLIAVGHGRRKAKVAHPDRWIQGGIIFKFDDITHYVTSTPGQESSSAIILFPVDASFVPKFIQVKGTRFRLPQPQALPSNLSGGLGAATAGSATVDTTGQPIPGTEIVVSNAIRPIRASTNMMPGGISEQDRYITDGFGEFSRGRGGLNIARNLQLRGVYEPPGTKMVMLDISRRATCNIFDSSIQDRVSPTDQLALVDSQGNTYSPIGYIYDKGDSKVDLKMAPGKFLRTFDELPYLPTAGEQTLRLYFRVTAGVTIVGFKYGDLTMGTCNLAVPTA